MRIRSQLIAAVAACVGLSIAAALLISRAAHVEAEASEVQYRAHSASHDVSGLLVLTQEYARHFEDRAAQQWYQRHSSIAATLQSDEARQGGTALKELRSVTQALPPLFQRLEELSQGRDAFTQRRREVLIDQMLTNTQAMSDFAYQWYQEAAQVRHDAEETFRTFAIALPLLMLAMMAALALAVRQRVLLPLLSLDRATARVTQGDLSVRAGTSRQDEFGDLSRRFDEMTGALARSNEEMQRTQRQLKAVTDSLPAFVAYVDKDLIYRYTNAYYGTVLGIDPASLIGTRLADRVGAEAFAELRDELAGVMRGEHRRFERRRTQRGAEVYHLVDYTPDVAADGTVVGFYVMANDITARKHAELAQARSEHMLRLIADNLPTLIAYIDLKERFVFANAQYERLLGVAAEAVIGRTVREILGEQTYALVSPHLQIAFGGQRTQFERVARLHEQTRHLLTDYIPEFDESGAVTGLFAMAVDVTALKNLQLAHAHDEERVRSILTHAPDAFISIDSDSRIQEWNRQAELTFGWTRDEVLGKSLGDTIIPPEHREAHRHDMRHFAKTGESPVVNQRIEITALHKAGRSLPIELSLAAVREGHGFAANAFLRDISERKLAETQLRDSERRLRDITDHIPAMIGYFDNEERCIFANSTVLRLNGLSRDDMHRHTLRSGIGEEAYAQHAPHIQRVLGGQLASFEGHVKRKGKDAYFQAHLVPDRPADGPVRGFYVMTFDVTPVRQAELDRARSEQRLRAITDNLPVLISYIDKDQKVRFANETYRTWLGADPAKLVGQHVQDVVGDSLYEPRRPFLERALAGERVEFENEALALNVLRTTQTTYIPDIDEQGEVRGLYTLSSDVTALKNVERQLQALARFDTLTGLPNRLQVNERLPEALARAERSRDSLAVMFLDIDRFKSINDSLGHATGDDVLKEFAQRLQSSVRTTDTVARLAGDEFVIILEGLHTEDEALAVAAKIIASVNLPMHAGGARIDVSTSIGVAFHRPAGALPSAKELLMTADTALYSAKDAGRNTFRMAHLSTEVVR